MTTRIKITLPTAAGRPEAEAVMTDLAQTMNQQRLLTARRDKEVLAINEKFEGDLAGLAGRIKTQTDCLRAWAEANPDQFPKDRKSIQFTSGILGFRTGTPKLALFSRAFNWERVLAQVQALLPDCVRTKKEVDKESLLNRYGQSADKTAADAEFRRLGVKVTQDESFFIEPDLTQFEPKQITQV